MLAFGNGAPDVFSAISAVENMKNGDVGLVFGALLGYYSTRCSIYIQTCLKTSRYAFIIHATTKLSLTMYTHTQYTYVTKEARISRLMEQKQKETLDQKYM